MLKTAPIWFCLISRPRKILQMKLKRQAPAGWLVEADITDERPGKEPWLRRAASKFGKVDILVNNAGISQLSYTATEDLSKAEWDKIIGINLTGTFLCCKHFRQGNDFRGRGQHRQYRYHRRYNGGDACSGILCFKSGCRFADQKPRS